MGVIGVECKEMRVVVLNLPFTNAIIYISTVQLLCTQIRINID